MAAEPRHSAVGVASSHEAETRSALCVSRKGAEARERRTNPPSHKECPACLDECQLPGVRMLSRESCLLRANVTVTFLCLSLLWSKIVSEALIPPGDAVRIGKTMPLKSEESYSESYMMTRYIIKTHAEQADR